MYVNAPVRSLIFKINKNYNDDNLNDFIVNQYFSKKYYDIFLTILYS